MRWIAWLGRRWPTALAVALAILTFGGSQSADEVRSLADVMALLPLEYLIVAKLQRREASWPVATTAIAVVFGLQALDVIAPSIVLSVVALIVLIWGAVDGQLQRSGDFRVQVLGTIAFGAFALAGLIVNPDVGRYVVAAGWFLHGVWDFVYLKLDRVVARSYAEWCGVVDVLIAAELVFLL
jgi:hypothetical protein